MAPTPAIPPPLPPSVEEAYRRKCIQLKRRTNEVEEDNEAARLRLVRLRRGVEKLRLERAFLLDQLAKRTSTNVEDSDGSPSPPPTPQDKPLRSKRGHRKPSIVAALESGAPGPPPTFINQSVHNLSPSSEAFSQNATGAGGDAASGSQPTKEGSAQRANGVSGESSSSTTDKTAKKMGGSFELYAAENRPALLESLGNDLRVSEELARRWSALSQSQQDEYKPKEKEATAEKPESEAKSEESAAAAPATAAATGAESQVEDTPVPDDDVDMEHDE